MEIGGPLDRQSGTPFLARTLLRPGEPDHEQDDHRLGRWSGERRLAHRPPVGRSSILIRSGNRSLGDRRDLLPCIDSREHRARDLRPETLGQPTERGRMVRKMVRTGGFRLMHAKQRHSPRPSVGGFESLRPLHH
jgi:hypothetical protein